MSNVKTIIQMKRFSCFAIFQIGFFLSLIGVLVVKYTEQLKLSTYQVSLYLSMNYVGYMLGGFLGDVFSKKIGQKKLMDRTLLMAAFIAIGSIIVKSYWLLLLLSIGLGLAGGFMEGQTNAVMGSVELEKADHNVNLGSTLMTFGYFSSCFIVALIMALGLPWKLIYVVIIGSSLLIWGVYKNLNFISVTEKKEVTGKQKSAKPLLKNKYFVTGCIAMCLYSGMEVMFFSWLTTFFESRGNISYVFSIVIMCCFYFFLLLGKCCNSVLMKFRKPVENAATAAIIAFLLLLALVNIQVFWLNCVCAAILGFCISCIPPFIIAFTGRQAGTDSAFSYVIGSAGIGTILIPGLVGILSARISMRIVLMIMSPVFLIEAILFLRLFYPKIIEEEKNENIHVDNAVS